MLEVQRDPLVCSWTGLLPRLPKPDSDGETDSSDDEDVQGRVRVPVSKFIQVDRRAAPVGKCVYYPNGDLPRRWHGLKAPSLPGACTTLKLQHQAPHGGLLRLVSLESVFRVKLCGAQFISRMLTSCYCTVVSAWATCNRLSCQAGDSTLLGTRSLNLEVAKKWQRALQNHVSTESSDSELHFTMSTFYWCNGLRELHSKLKKVKLDLKKKKWKVRDVGTRWRGVASAIHASMMLGKFFLLKSLYTCALSLHSFLLLRLRSRSGTNCTL
jgi:hypothetical protein